MAIPFRVPAILLLLSCLLYFSLRQAIQNTPPIDFSLDRVVESDYLSQFSLRELEVFLRGILEKSRSGQSISHESEVNLNRIKALLAMHPNANQKLVARLIALIEEILELNSELIHHEDGTHQTDDT